MFLCEEIEDTYIFLSMDIKESSRSPLSAEKTHSGYKDTGTRETARKDE